jgi:hypothetical protein
MSAFVRPSWHSAPNILCMLFCSSWRCCVHQNDLLSSVRAYNICINQLRTEDILLHLPVP